MSLIQTELLELKAAVSEIATKLDALLETIALDGPDESNEEFVPRSAPDAIKDAAAEGLALDVEIPDEPISRTPPPLAAEVTSTDMPNSGDNLLLIKGIDARCQSILTLCDVHAFADIASFRAEDVRKLNELLGSCNRIQRENWIEQAAILAEGRTTRFSKASKCHNNQLNKEKPIVSESKPSQTLQANAEIIPFPTHPSLSSESETGMPSRSPMWRSVAACLTVGALAVPLVTGKPTGDAFEPNLQTARLWCGHQQAGRIGSCYSHEFKAADALR